MVGVLCAMVQWWAVWWAVSVVCRSVKTGVFVAVVPPITAELVRAP